MSELLGKRIKSLRTENNFKQEEVAEYLGISRQKYARIENGVNNVTFSILTKIAERYAITVADITRVFDEDPVVAYRKNAVSESLDSFGEIFDMIDLLYANKEVYSRMKTDKRG